MKKDEKIVMYDSDEAAKFVTNISGWVDRHGYFKGNLKGSEDVARYSGCTHKLCECGNLMEKYRTRCGKCYDAFLREKHSQREVVEWDGKTLLYDNFSEQFFHSEDEIEDYLFENQEIKKDDLMLVLCEPMYFRTIGEDYWYDDLPDDVDFDDFKNWKDVLEAMNNLNGVLQQCGPSSWTPGKKAVKL